MNHWMQTVEDIELLREHAQRNSEDAFETLVARHVNLVYSPAGSCVRSLMESFHDHTSL